MLRFGPRTGPVIVIALPLFEEANRTRVLAVTICRALAKRGVASMLPDVPGQGESLVPLERCDLRGIADGIDKAVTADREAGRPLYGVTIRSGAMLDKPGLFAGRWHFAPQDGPELLRDLKRIKQAAQGSVKLNDPWYLDTDLPADAAVRPVEVAGNLLSTDLLTALTMHEAWQPDAGLPLRTVRLDGDARPADRHVPGPSLWRRAEPANDPALAALLADDIADWIAACAG